MVAKSHKKKINKAKNCGLKILSRDKIFVENYIKHDNHKSVSEDSPSMPSVVRSARDDFEIDFRMKQREEERPRKPQENPHASRPVVATPYHLNLLSKYKMW